jgi:hypothetical protein
VIDVFGLITSSQRRGVLVVDSGGIYALLKHIILPGLYLVEENNLGITSCKGELLTRISF